MGIQRRLACAIWIGFAPVLAYSPAGAQDADFALAEDRFHERLDERGRVSGDIVMGVMFGPAYVGENDDRPMADLAPRQSADVEVWQLPAGTPEAGARLFCVRINSKDGRFEAENTYEVSGDVAVSGGRFPYQGLHAPVLNAMRATSLVKVGRCGDRTHEVVPSAWVGTGPPPGRQSLHVFVNSAGNPTGAIVGSDPDFIPCADVADASTLKYTASCILPFETLAAQKQGDRVSLTFHVTRSLGEETFAITVVLPDEGA